MSEINGTEQIQCANIGLKDSDIWEKGTEK